MYVTSSQVTPRGGRRHTVGHVTGGKAHHTTLQCCHLHALAQSNRQAAHMNLAANTMGGEHTCCRHTMPAHGSSHHGWRIFTDNAGSRSRMFRACICKYYMSTTDLTYPWNLYITKYFTVNVHAKAVIPYKASSTLCNFLYSPSHRLAT